MNGNEVLQQAVGFATYYMQQVTADVSPEIAHRDPGGTMQTIAATYAHATISTDWLIHNVFGGRPAFYESDWAGKTGASKVSPVISPEWGKSVQVDLSRMNAYAQAVFGAAMAALSNTELDRELDLTAFGMGKQTLGWCHANLVAGHLTLLTGEIAAVKGVFGLKGDAF